jgi:hypothetical protein
MAFKSGPIAEVIVVCGTRGTRVTIASLAGTNEEVRERWNELGAALQGYVSKSLPEVYAFEMRRVMRPHQVWLHDRLLRAGFVIVASRTPEIGDPAITPNQKGR